MNDVDVRTDQKTNVKRRDFLRGIGLAAGSAAGVAVMTVAPAPVAAEEADASSGYRETDHVRTVYQTARF